MSEEYNNYGAVAFLDILGYQNFLRQNSISKETLKLLKVIKSTPKEAKEIYTDAFNTYKKKLNGEHNKLTEEVIKSFNYLVFSDTIILSFPISYHNNKQKILALYLLQAATMIVMAEMLKAGFPMRGSIQMGEFIFDENCFAGRAIIDAHDLCSNLDFSGVVISESVVQTIQDIAKKNPGNNLINLLKNHQLCILTPRKNGKEQKETHLNWLKALHKDELKVLKSDINQYVMKSFWAHGKDCPSSVDSKVNNTVKMIRRMIISIEEEEERAKEKKQLSENKS